jgi:hypothetical protein
MSAKFLHKVPVRSTTLPQIFSGDRACDDSPGNTTKKMAAIAVKLMSPRFLFDADVTLTSVFQVGQKRLASFMLLIVSQAQGFLELRL